MFSFTFLVVSTDGSVPLYVCLGDYLYSTAVTRNLFNARNDVYTIPFAVADT
jgi:hypothetical protein